MLSILIHSSWLLYATYWIQQISYMHPCYAVAGLMSYLVYAINMYIYIIIILLVTDTMQTGMHASLHGVCNQLVDWKSVLSVMHSVIHST